MLLKTDRLIIEYFNTSDISDWAKIESDADVRRFVDGKVLSFEEASKYVEMNIRQYQTHGYGRYAVRLKENRKLITRGKELVSDLSLNENEKESIFDLIEKESPDL